MGPPLIRHDPLDFPDYLGDLARFGVLGALDWRFRDRRDIALHCESAASSRPRTVPGRTDHDAHLEGKSVDRLDAGRHVGDVVGGVPPASGLPAHHVLLPIGVHLREPQGYYGAGGGYGMAGGGYYDGGYTGGTAGYPGGYGYGQPGSGYDFGRPGYNPGGLGGPASGLGVRPGLGVGGFGPGR